LAHLWKARAGAQWTSVPLDGDSIDLTPEDVTPAVVTLLRQLHGSDARWFLVARGRARVRVNGALVVAGLRALDDRDEIRVESAPVIYYSTERLAVVEVFAGASVSLHCPRCKLPIETGAPIVRCPACNVSHHQTSELPCWTYAEHCTLCAARTELSTRYRWSPEVLS
jgi:hypothetical protein